MILQTMTEANCFLYSCAMAFDVPAADLAADLGCTGLEIQWPENPIPTCYRGFHIQEMMDYGFSHDYALVPMLRHAYMSPDRVSDPLLIKGDGLIRRSMSRFNGVIIYDRSPGHAVAWDGEQVYDPRGMIENLTVNIYMFIAFVKVAD